MSLPTARAVRAVLFAALTVAVPPADPAVMPAFRLTKAERCYIKALGLLARSRRADRYDGLILAEARARGLDPRLLKAVMAAESGFDPAAVSVAGARGLMQVMPATAREMGVMGDLHDPAANVRAGAAYLQLLHRAAFKRFGIKGRDYARAPRWVQHRVVAAYNAGPRALTGERWPTQTRHYAAKVMLFQSSDLARLRRVPEPTAAAR
jgi:soluble lytic murein transglycosylase-like protein